MRLVMDIWDEALPHIKKCPTYTKCRGICRWWKSVLTPEMWIVRLNQLTKMINMGNNTYTWELWVFKHILRQFIINYKHNIINWKPMSQHIQYMLVWARAYAKSIHMSKNRYSHLSTLFELACYYGDLDIIHTLCSPSCTSPYNLSYFIPDYNFGVAFYQLGRGGHIDAINYLLVYIRQFLTDTRYKRNDNYWDRINKCFDGACSAGNIQAIREIHKFGCSNWIGGVNHACNHDQAHVLDELLIRNKKIGRMFLEPLPIYLKCRWISWTDRLFSTLLNNKFCPNVLEWVWKHTDNVDWDELVFRLLKYIGITHKYRRTKNVISMYEWLKKKGHVVPLSGKQRLMLSMNITYPNKTVVMLPLS